MKTTEIFAAGGVEMKTTEIFAAAIEVIRQYNPDLSQVNREATVGMCAQLMFPGEVRDELLKTYSRGELKKAAAHAQHFVYQLQQDGWGKSEYLYELLLARNTPETAVEVWMQIYTNWENRYDLVDLSDRGSTPQTTLEKLFCMVVLHSVQLRGLTSSSWLGMCALCTHCELEGIISHEERDLMVGEAQLFVAKVGEVTGIESEWLVAHVGEDKWFEIYQDWGNRWSKI